MKPAAAGRSDLPLRRGDVGDSVTDLHRRLGQAGYEVASDHYQFSAATEMTLRRFQDDRGLVVDGVCGPQTWTVLVEADHRLGDRMLYYRFPMMRGDDVTNLQHRLGQLGFDTGWFDGIFGPNTEAAVREFQHNVGTTIDGVVGRNTLIALDRLAARPASNRTITEVREVEWLRTQPNRVEGWRLVIGDTGELPTIAQSVARRLRRTGATVLSLSTPALSQQARTANAFQGAAYVGVTLVRESLQIAYFSTRGFESTGGRALASQCATGLVDILPRVSTPMGMRLPILRETRMPAIWCRLGPGSVVVTRAPSIACALADAIVAWCSHPGGH